MNNGFVSGQHSYLSEPVGACESTLTASYSSFCVVDVPARLRRELDAVLTLQTELTAIDNYLNHVKKAISDGSDNPEVFRFLQSLQRTHGETLSKVEELYTSLNVTDIFPEIEGLPLEFVRMLLLARDLKMNIRKRAIGTFFEWDKLDRAAGGRDQPLG